MLQHVSSKNASLELTDILLNTKTEHCYWKVYKKVLIFSCLVQLQNNLNIIGLLVISDCVYSKVIKNLGKLLYTVSLQSQEKSEIKTYKIFTFLNLGTSYYIS